ncbi:hypothetical protein BH09ACT6_BH09ACT6_07840 [soil metagenome]
MALIVTLALFGALAVAGIIAAVIEIAKDGYGHRTTQTYFNRLP